MLFTPILPEAASGSLEPRHVVVPLRMMCPHAELLLGRLTRARRGAAHGDGRDRRRRRFEVGYEQAVLALGSIAGRCRSPAWRSTRSASRTSQTQSTSATTCCASSRRRWPRWTRAGPRRTSPSCSSARAMRASRRWPSSQTSSATPSATTRSFHASAARWVLVDAAPKILPEIPSRLGRLCCEAAARKRGRDQGRRRRSHRSGAARRPVRRTAHPHPHARLDGRRQPEPDACRARPAYRRARARQASTRCCASRATRACGRSATAHAFRTSSRPACRIRPPPSMRSARRAGSRRTCAATPKPYRYRSLGPGRDALAATRASPSSSASRCAASWAGS